MQPLPLRDEAQPGYVAKSWNPNWNCFCCHDIGIIPERIVKIEIPSYVSGRHKPVKCNATGCNIRLGDTLYETNTLDTRFTSEICDRLASEERQMWKEWSQQQHEKRKQSLRLIDGSNITNNLRIRSRKNYEQFDVECRHQNIRNDY